MEYMKILIFTEGTIIMHKDGESIHDFASYIPISQAVDKLKTWANQGAEILYLTSRTKSEEIKDIKNVLKKYHFPEGELLFRQKGEEYKDVAERLIPDILIEDDCQSIGGADEMTITHIKPEIRKRVKSIPVKEFGGIDHLPDDVSNLIK
jgi:hypothetical protein